MKCKFEYSDEKQAWVCSVCGRIVQAPKENVVHADCKRGANFIQKAVHYATAVVTHIATGAKTRTDEEVEQLLAICQQCEKYNALKGYCRVCGCKCNNLKNAFLNKLRMESQHCPEKKW